MKVQALTALLSLLIVANEAKTMEKCELAKTLKNHGMDGYHGYKLGNWVCMAYHESRYNTKAVGPPNKDGSQDYGIFQINSKYWCTDGKHPSKNGCKKSCSRVCLAYYESSYNSRLVGPKNSNGSRDYGIFQINSRWWCSNGQGTTNNGCKKSCSSYTNDDITDDIECAKRIVRDPNKMNAWYGWKNNCKGKNLSKWVSGCGV